MEEGAEECACRFDPEKTNDEQEGRGWLNWRNKDDDLNHRLEVELCHRPLSARVCGLAVDALAVTFHLGQILVEDLA